MFSCNDTQTVSYKEEVQKTSKEIIIKEFQNIIDSVNVRGAILVYDVKADHYFSNDFAWVNKGKLPASTFKIVNSIIGLETKELENDSIIFKWDGAPRDVKSWEQDLTLRNAFHFSCVPCYQSLARDIGTKRMNEYLNKLNYGDIKVDSTNIDMFWLEGESKISLFQQIDFLKRFYNSKLPIAERTEKIMKRLMIIEENNDYKLSGKTGWSITEEHHNGWFVGYIETSNNTYFFATNLEPKIGFDMNKFPSIRKEVTIKALSRFLS